MKTLIKRFPENKLPTVIVIPAEPAPAEPAPAGIAGGLPESRGYGWPD